MLGRPSGRPFFVSEMPYKIAKRNGKFCVVKRDEPGSDPIGCHASEQAAKRQMAALYANEKELSMDEEKMYEDSPVVGRAYGGATTFDELLTEQEAQEAAWKIRDLTYQFQGLVDNIMWSDIDDKSAAIRSLTEEFVGLVEKQPQNKSVWDQLKELVKRKPKEKEVNEFMVWKEEDQWRWFAIFSNKFRDEDNPPEILSEAAHKEFVKAVDDGKWDHPELWIWHVPGTKIGYTDVLTYDDRGFVLASGIITDSHAAKGLSEMKGLKVSHGMLGAEMERDEKDATIITRYRTVEISPLPDYAAANKLTGFVTVGGDMAIPKEKRELISQLLDEERLEELEATIGELSKQAADLESKESEVPEEETKEEEVPEVNYVTHEEVVESVGSVFGELNSKLDALIAKFDTVEAEVKALKEAEEERDSMTPAASLTDMIKNRAVGNEGARIDGRTKEAKEGPQLPPGFSVDGPTPIPFLNQFMAQGR